MQNIAFSKVLKINGRVWEFNFRKLPNEDFAFHTDFTDAKDNRVQFVLFRDVGESWKIKGLVPSWLPGEIGLLRQAINEHVPMPV